MKAEIEICDVCGDKIEYGDGYILSLEKEGAFPPSDDSELLTMCGDCRKKYLKELNKMKKLKIKWQVVQ